MKKNKEKEYPTLKWSALQAGDKSGLPFFTEDGNLTPEFKIFWQMFKEELYEWEKHLHQKYIQRGQTILLLMALFMVFIELATR